MARAEYQYSTSPRKLEPEYRSQKRKQKLRVVEDLPRQEVKVSKEQKRKRIQLTITVIAIQIVYVSLPKKDYVESASEKVVIKDQTNWFEKLVNKIFNK